MAATQDPSPDDAGPDDAESGSATCMRHLLRRPPRRRSRARRAVLGVAAFVASLAVLAAVAGAWGIVQLSQGPIAFDMKRQIVAALDARIGHGFHFDFSGTAVEMTDHGPALTIRGLSVADASSRPVVSAPSAAVAVDPMALLLGRIAPTRFDIHGVDLRLVIRPDGQVAVSAGSDATALPLGTTFAASPASPADVAPAGAAPTPGAVPAPTRPGDAALRAMSAALRPLIDAATAPGTALDALERVHVSGRILLDDRVHGTTTVFRNTVLGFERDAAGGPVLTVSGDGASRRWTLEARVGPVAPDGRRVLTVEARNLTLDEIALAGGLRSPGFDSDMPATAKMVLGLAPDGGIEAVTGSFSLGAGYFRLDDPDHEPLLIDAVTGRFHLDSNTDGIAVDRIEIHGPPFDFAAAGQVGLPRNPGDPWTLRAEASGSFAPERPGERPIRIARLALGGRLLTADHHTILDRLDIAGPEVDFTANADIQTGPGGLHVRSTSSVRHMQAQTLVRLWPTVVAAPVRAWLLTNIKGGMVESGTAAADLDEADFALMKAEKSVADGHVHVGFGVSNLSLAFMAGVPPLADVAATGTVTGRGFAMDVQHGDMEVSPGGHRLTLADGSFRIPDNDPKPTPATVEAHITGGVDTVAELLSRDALKPYANLPTDGAPVHGQVDGHLTVGFKIGKDVPPDSSTIAVSATATNFALDKLIGKEGLTDATVKLDVDKAGLHAKGDGRLYGVATTLDIRKPATGAGEAVIALVLDDAARTRAGLGGAGGLKGAVAARITASLASGDRTRASVDLDFARASIDGLVPGFTKPLGRPARATLTAQVKDGGTSLDAISFDGGGASLRGSAEITKDGDFASAKFTQVKLSPGDDMKVDVQQSGDVLKVTARGANLDARPFLKWLSAPAPPGAPPGDAAKGALDLDLRSAILTGQNGQAVTGADLHLTRRGGQVRRLTLTGRLGRQPLGITTAQIDNAPHFLIQADDAGASLLFMDLYKRMAGGKLDANLVMIGTRLDGYATVHDFTVREDPAIRKLATEGLASQKHEDPAASGDATAPLDLSAMSFKKLEASFSKSGSVVEVRDGSMFGPQLGATVSGTIDFSRDQVNLAGTFVPLFGVNNLFSQVPVLGPLLGGGRHEGLLGLNYRITGSATNPVLNVNPLSVLAPGFLRQIFGAFDGAAQNGATHPDRAGGLGPRAEEE